MSTNQVDNSQDVIDSRDVIERLEELEGERESLVEDIDNAQEELEGNSEPGFEDNEQYEEALEEAKQALADWDTENGEELKALTKLVEDAEGSPDWQYGETLIRDSYFAEYAEELCKDIGDIPKELPWYIANHIDWEGVAREIQMDYTSVDFDGVEYWIRA